MTVTRHVGGMVSDAIGLTPEQQEQLANLTLLLDTKADQQYVLDQIAQLVGTAPEALDTIHELAAAIASETTALDALNEMVAYRVRFDIANQVLTELQKQNARGNIGAEAAGVAAGLVAAITPASIGAATASAALTQISALNPAANDVLQFRDVGGGVFGWINRTIAQLKLDIGIGTTADKINNLCQLYMLENLIGIPTYMSSFNEPWFLQNNLSQHTVRLLQANGLGGTTFSQLGLSAYTTHGTPTGVATAQGSEWLQLTRCAMAVSGLNTIAGWYTTALTHYYPAASINFGHVMSIGFGVRDSAGGALIPDARMFVGETTSITNPTNIDPKTMTNAIGVIQSTTLPNPNNLYFYVNGSSAAGYLFDTGMAVSLTTGYRLTIFNIKGTRKVLMRLSDINTDAAVNHVVDIDLLPANQQPLSTAGYGTRLWRASANGTIGTPLQIVLSKIYLEGKN